MTPQLPALLTRSHRVYFASVGLFALWVGLWGTLMPGEIVRAIPWTVPPLHARFLGAMYLSGLVLMGGSLLARHLHEVRIALPMAAIWTGMLMLVSLLHLDTFDFSHRPVWFWFFAYAVFPVTGAWLGLQASPIAAPSLAPDLPGWIRVTFDALGAVCIVVAALLFFVPAWMTSVWPWKIPVLLAQIYAGPFLSYGVGSLLVARRRHGSEIRLPALAMAAFAILVLIASLIHHNLFIWPSPSAVLWFGGFVLAGATLVTTSWQAIRAGRG